MLGLQRLSGYGCTHHACALTGVLWQGRRRKHAVAAVVVKGPFHMRRAGVPVSLSPSL